MIWSNCIGVHTAIFHRCSHLARFHCRSLLGRLFISLAMAKKVFCNECGHELVLVNNECDACSMLHTIKLRCKYGSISELKSMPQVPLSYSKGTQTDDSSYMHRFIRALLLRRPDGAIDKAVKENRWKDAYELEIKYRMEAAMSTTSDGPVRFAYPPK